MVDLTVGIGQKGTARGGGYVQGRYASSARRCKFVELPRNRRFVRIFMWAIASFQAVQGRSGVVRQGGPGASVGVSKSLHASGRHVSKSEAIIAR